MTRDLKPGTFEDFVRWLGEANSTSDHGAEDPTPEILAAARVAWEEFQGVRQTHQQSLMARLRSGTYHEELELMAAADADRGRWLPRLRTPNGFAISALYGANAPPEAAPMGLLVECPAELIEVCRGQPVHIAAGGQWVELGEIDVDGKAMGDLPAGFEFKPPFAFRVGKLAEEPSELRKPDQPE